jgi:hypothetical protein
MQRSASCGTEEAVKNSANNDVSTHPSGDDVEKAAIKPSDGANAEDFVDKAQRLPDQNEQDLFDPKDSPDSGDSTLTVEEEEEDDFPEGGLRGYCVVIGVFCGLFSVFGIINSTGILLEYFSTHQLKDYTSSQIGWYVYFFKTLAKSSSIFEHTNADSGKDLRSLLVLDLLLRSSHRLHF